MAALPSGVEVDVNGDGRDDDVYVEEFGAPWPGTRVADAVVVAVARGREAGAPQQIGVADPDRLRITTEGRILRAFVVGDLDRDGRADVALVRQTAPRANQELLVVAGRAGSGTIVATSSTSLLHRVLPRADDDVYPAGDVDGDQHADILIHRNARTLLALHGGAPPERPRTVLRIAATARDAGLFSGTAAGDVNADGFGDIVVELDVRSYCGEGGCPGRSVVVWGGPRARTVYVRGNMRDGYTLRAADRRPAGFVLNGGLAEAVGDLDGDRRDDLMAAFDTETGAVVYGKRNAATVNGGRGEAPSTWRGLSPIFGATDGSAIGDTNGDGLADVVVAVGHEWRILLGRRERWTGTVARRPAWRFQPPRGYKVDSAAAAGDVNGDGLDDLAVTASRPPLDSREFVILGDRSHDDVDLDAIDARGYEILDGD